MEYDKRALLKAARPETKPEVSGKIRRKAKLFGKQKLTEYYLNYYEEESESRVPFYLPYIYGKELFDFLCRLGKIPKKQVRMILIDGEDTRIDYILELLLEEMNYLTIVTDRKAYFESLQERAFQELGLLIDLVHPWEEKNLTGNLVWDFTEKLQRPDCYPPQSVCFLPHKKEWKLQELQRSGNGIQTVSLAGVQIGEYEISCGMAEAFLVPKDFPFRKSRCEDLQYWCKAKKFGLKLKVGKGEKP